MLKRVVNRILREVLEVPIIKVPSEISYQAAVEQHAQYLPKLTIQDRHIVDSLKREGIFMTSLESLGISSTSQLVNAATNLLPELAVAVPENKQEYVVHADSQQVMTYPELFLWGAEERLLNIVENYIGIPISYHGLYFRKDLANGVEAKSRLWHLDMEDRRMTKIIVYLHDVDDDCGPFQYISKNLTSFLCDSLKYKYGYVRDQAVEAVIPPTYWQSCTGKAGTVIFVDTASIFHRGKTPITSDRYTLFFDYTSRQPKNAFYCKSSLPEVDLIALADKLSQRQKESILWRKPLSFI